LRHKENGTGNGNGSAQGASQVGKARSVKRRGNQERLFETRACENRGNVKKTNEKMDQSSGKLRRTSKEPNRRSITNSPQRIYAKMGNKKRACQRAREKEGGKEYSAQKEREILRPQYEPPNEKKKLAGAWTPEPALNKKKTGGIASTSAPGKSDKKKRKKAGRAKPYETAPKNGPRKTGGMD